MKRATGIPPSSYVVLGCLMHYIDYRLYCHPGVRLIAKRTQLTENTVKKSIKDLESRGILLVIRKSKALNRYQIRPQKHWKSEAKNDPDENHLRQKMGQISEAKNDPDENSIHRENWGKNCLITKEAHKVQGGGAVAQSVLEEPSANHDDDHESLAFG